MSCRLNRILLRWLRPLAVAGFAFVIVWGYALIALNLSFLNPISDAIKSFSITDKYYQMMDERESQAIVIVDLTPLRDRADTAFALQEIVECQPAAIGVDCIFEGEKPDTLADNALRELAAECPNIIFSYRLLDEQPGGIGYTKSVHSFFADEIPVHEGVTNMQRDNLYSGIKRKLNPGWTLNGEKRPSFVGELVNLYAGKEMMKADDDALKINFAPTEFLVIPPSEILASREEIEGRIVLFGTMTDENDMHYTPLGKMAGVKLLAYATQTVIEGSQVRKLPLWLLVICSLLWVMLTNAMQEAVIRLTSGSKHLFVRHIIGSVYVRGLITFLWVAFFVWAAFLCFSLYNISIEMAWAIAAIAFLATSRNFCAMCENYYLAIKERNKK